MISCLILISPPPKAVERYYLPFETKILYSDFNMSLIMIPAAVSPKIPGMNDMLP